MTWRKRIPETVLLVGGLLFIDLFLGWHHAHVSVAGVVDVGGDSSAWAGWGAVAGVLVIALLAWEALHLRGSSLAARVGGEVTACLLAVGTAAFTAIEFFSGTASVRSGGVVAIDVSGRQWPAYVGLVLAGALVVLTIAQLEIASEQPDSVSYGVR